MVGETLNAPSPSRPATQRSGVLPKHLLYSIFARIGGSGLDTDAFETLRASHRGGFLGRAIAYDNRQNEIPAHLIQSLRWHPVRLISFLDRPYYYGAKKKYLDWIASRQLATGRYDLFHSWSGDCLQSLRVTRKLGIPSIVEIPTWHRDRGKVAERSSLRPAASGRFSLASTLERKPAPDPRTFSGGVRTGRSALRPLRKSGGHLPRPGFSRGKTVLSPSRSRHGAFQTGRASADLSRGLFGSLDRAQGHSPSSGSVASARPQRRGALAGRLGPR